MRGSSDHKSGSPHLPYASIGSKIMMSVPIPQWKLRLRIAEDPNRLAAAAIAESCLNPILDFTKDEAWRRNRINPLCLNAHHQKHSNRRLFRRS